MLMFRPMREEEYPAYLEYFITDYAQEIAANYRLSEEEALTSAKQEIAATLPEGVNTPGHVLLCLLVQDESNHKHTGYLWYKPDPGMQTVFIYDFHIFTACQGRGLGKDALRAFEDEMRARGVEQIRLRVAGDNARARHVYEASGFGVTGINMSKSIKRE
ncbi:GNAT family N-acetyltransferase [Cronobacter turicensis]|nr:GNAT family N-acetyltransferase [Cronobacter turicensis]